MKVAFLFAHKTTDTWSTPLAIVNEFKRRMHNVDIYSLFDSNGNYTDNGLRDLLHYQSTTNKKYDIIIHMDYGRFHSPLFHDFNLMGDTFCVLECGDDPQNQSVNITKIYDFDLILTPDYMSAEKYKSKHKSKSIVWWTHFADTALYNDTIPCIRQSYEAVSSRGYGNSPFLDTLERLTEGRFISRNGFEGINHAIFLNSAPIVVQNSRFGEITRRIFEGLALKKLVLTDALSYETHLHDLFINGEDIILYTSMADCMNKMTYMYNHPDIASKIALSGYNKVIKDHTQVSRVDLILNEYHKWKTN